MVEGITRREGVKGGRPILEGTKLSVLQVVELVREHEMMPGEIVAAYPNVDDVELVHAALRYYDENPEEMARLAEEREHAKNRILEQAIVY